MPGQSYRKTKFLKVLEPIKKGAYFYFTIPYGLFYICGAVAGYSLKKSVLCLGVSGAIGFVFVLLGECSQYTTNKIKPIMLNKRSLFYKPSVITV